MGTVLNTSLAPALLAPRGTQLSAQNVLAQKSFRASFRVFGFCLKLRESIDEVMQYSMFSRRRWLLFRCYDVDYVVTQRIIPQTWKREATSSLGLQYFDLYGLPQWEHIVHNFMMRE